jgi:RNAse (barnase) inhibitor barstar
MKLDSLLRSREPWLHVLLAAESDVCDELWALQRLSEKRTVCRVIRGHKATTKPAFFDECAAAWQFPYYFGENWDAFEECLTDLQWLPAEAYVFCVTRAVHLLEKEPSDQQQRLLLVLQGIAKEWGQATPSRPAAVFHVLLHCTAEERPSLDQRLQGAAVSHDVIQCNAK